VSQLKATRCAVLRSGAWKRTNAKTQIMASASYSRNSGKRAQCSDEPRNTSCCAQEAQAQLRPKQGDQYKSNREEMRSRKAHHMVPNLWLMFPRMPDATTRSWHFCVVAYGAGCSRVGF
jgi:hypothetical protein